MALFEKLSVIFSVYAAILSTILAVIKIHENRKSVKIQLIYTTFYETITLRITNKSKNPILIQSITIKVHGKESVPINAIFEDDIPVFPHKISPFDLWDNNLQYYSIKSFLDNKELLITVSDSEGDSFTGYSFFENNGKFGDFEKKRIRKN